jgi:hypothetical protein
MSSPNSIETNENKAKDPQISSVAMHMNNDLQASSVPEKSQNAPANNATGGKEQN